MKIKTGFISRKLGGDNIVIPIGQNIADFNGVMKLNETAVFLWEQLQQQTTKEKLICSLCEEFNVSKDEAVKDVTEFLQTLEGHRILEA